MLHLTIKRVWIERFECLAHTLCESEVPGLIEYDESHGVYRVKEEALSHAPSELKQLLEASSVCPMHAFHIETEDGYTFNVQNNEMVRAAIKAGRYSWSSVPRNA